jgi:3-oxoadipate enol-lactonase
MDQFVAVDGCRIFTRAVGADQSKSWLVLSNSLACDHTMWTGELDWLTDTHRVLLYDTRGHGRSAEPSGRIDLVDLVADVVAILDRHGIGTAVHMGLSMGGMTGLGLALSDTPRISAVICCNARSDAPPPFVNMWADRISRVEGQGLNSIFDDTLARWVSPGRLADSPSEAARLEAMFYRTSPAGYVACARALQKLDYRRYLSRISIPALFVAGEDDVAAPADVMRDMADAVPGAQFAVVPGARHLSNIDDPAGFRAAVEPFLKQAAG